MGDVTIKPVEEGDVGGCIELLARTFPGRSDGSTFSWRFERPEGKRPILICAKCEENVVAFNSWIPWPFIYRGTEYTGYQSGETGTDVAFRGRGLFSRILREADRVASNLGIDFFFGFPNRLSRGALHRVGYYPIGAGCFCLRPLNPFMKRDPEGSNHEEISFVEAESLVEPDKISVCVTEEYCQWRYLDNPKQYEIIGYSENHSKALFVVKKKIWKGIPELILLDCHFNNYNPDFVKNAIHYLDCRYYRKVIYIRTFFNERTDRGKILRKFFPLKIRSKFQEIVVKPVSNAIDRRILLNINNWDYLPHIVDEY